MKKIIAITFAFLSLGNLALAKEGMFTPEQLPQIASELRSSGLVVPAVNLTSLTSFPMSAIVDLEGCSGSFVSDAGLVVTNHHCAREAVQYNSTEQTNYLEDGFLAKSRGEELPAPPGTHILVTVDFSDVTADVLNGTQKLTGKARFDKIESNQKSLIAQCEQDAEYRCSVPAFFDGLEYKLIKQLEIKDVRLAYAPADSIGKYGGDIDNWLWPRHTGDFAFYRAYVDPQGKAVQYNKDNIPFVPPHHLKVSAKPLKEHDFVMAVGYPGSTSRYARTVTVKYVFDWLYPTYINIVSQWISAIEQAAPNKSEARIKYEDRLAGLNNFLKNTQGQIEGAQRVDLVNRRKIRDTQLSSWLASDPSRIGLKQSIERLDDLLSQQETVERQQFWYLNVKRSALLDTATTLYKNAIEKEKPDAQREFGFQDRDLERRQQQILRVDRRFDIAVDKAEWLTFINLYLAQPESERINAFETALLANGSSVLSMSDRLDNLYQNTELLDAQSRLAFLKASKTDLENSNDPFIKMAVALYSTDKILQDEFEDLQGKASALQPEYMKAIIAWQSAQGKIAYPDANSTLRVTYGKVLGGSPRDGLLYEPFTRVEGIVEKDTGKAPFNSPEKQLNLIKQQFYGIYRDPSLHTVPVNFLTDLDSTGGNSGSATLNGNAELVGLLFDGTLESVNSDWDFDPRTTRAIHVDTRYMLWVMEYVDGATNLINEMDIVGQSH